MNTIVEANSCSIVLMISIRVVIEMQNISASSCNLSKEIVLSSPLMIDSANNINSGSILSALLEQKQKVSEFFFTIKFNGISNDEKSSIVLISSGLTYCLKRTPMSFLQCFRYKHSFVQVQNIFF